MIWIFFNFDPIDIDVEVKIKPQSNEKNTVVLETQINSDELVFRKINAETSIATVNVFIRITSIDYKFKGCYEEQIKFNINKDEFEKDKKLNLSKSFELLKGIYRLNFVLRDVEKGSIGIRIQAFEIK